MKMIRLHTSQDCTGTSSPGMNPVRVIHWCTSRQSGSAVQTCTDTAPLGDSVLMGATLKTPRGGRVVVYPLNPVDNIHSDFYDRRQDCE